MMKFDFHKRTHKIIKQLRIFGVWYDDKNWTFDLYFLYSVIINVYYNLHIAAQAANIIYHYNDMNEWSSSGLLTLTEFLTNVKVYCVIKNEGRILKIDRMVNKSSFQPKNGQQEKIANSTLKIFDMMYFLHTMGPTMTVAFFALYPIPEIKTNRKLPFSAWYPYDYKQSPLFELTYFHQLSGSLVAAFMHLNADCLAINMIAIIIVQLNFLLDNVRNIGNLKQNQKIKDLALFECINHHKEIIECCDEVYQMLNIYFLGQFILSTTSLCLTSLQLSMVTPTSAHFIALMVYVLALLIQLLMLCWWGNELILKSEQIPQAAFECNWAEASTSFQKSLLFFIHRTQKPMTLYAINFFQVSLGTFVLIIKNSYSFFAVLRHLHNQDPQN